MLYPIGLVSELGLIYAALPSMKVTRILENKEELNDVAHLITSSTFLSLVILCRHLENTVSRFLTNGIPPLATTILVLFYPSSTFQVPHPTIFLHLVTGIVMK